MRSKKYSSAEALSLVMAIFMVCCLTTLAKAADMGPILSAETRCGSLTSPSQTDAYTFTGNAGNTVVIQMNAPTFSFYSVIDLYAPDGILENSVVGYNTALLQNYQLLQSGLYTIVVREDGGNVSSDYCLSFLIIPGPTVSPQDTDGGDIVSGEIKYGSILSADTDAYTFTGNAGNTVVIQMNAPTFSFYSVIDLYAPDGILENSVVGYNTALLQNYQLLQSGLYTVVVRENGGDVTSDYNLSLTKVPGALQSPLIRITLNNNEFLPGDTLTATLNIKNGPVSTNVEAKVWIQLPDGNEIRLIQQPAVSLSSNMNTNFPILNYTFTGTEAAGTWAVGAMVENPITGRDISMDIVPFTVSH